MPFIEINWNPPPRQLRQFAWISVAALPLIGWLWGANSQVLLGLVAIGAVLVAFSYALPGFVKPLFLTLSIITLPIGLIVGEIVMLFIYFVVFLPVGVWLRLFGRSAITKRPNRSQATYWQARKRPAGLESYFRQG